MQPLTIDATKTSSLLTLTFGYGTTDNNGNVLSQQIQAPGTPTALNATQYYKYDALNRLGIVAEGVQPSGPDTCPTTAGTWCRDYGYDRYGNRAVTGSFNGGLSLATPTLLTDYNTANNRLKSASPAWANYDAAGNITAFLKAGYEWSAFYDAENKQRFYCGATTAACSSANDTAEYRYDGEGNRVQKITASETVTYVYDAFGRLAAEYSTAGPSGTAGSYFRTVDHLGSTRLVTNGSGNVHDRRDFFPFGEQILASSTYSNRHYVSGYNNTSLASRHLFTAKERDQESGLDYFGARYMSSSLGHFTSADAPFMDQHTSNPQSWNLYGYVRNNPLRLVDADGRKVRVSDKVALEHIRSTVPAAVRESVVVTGSGTIDSDKLNGVTSDNENVRALKFMANHSSLVEVRTDSGVEMGEFGVVEFEYTPYTLQDGTPAPTIFGGTTSEMTDTNGRIVVTLSDGTGKAADMPGEEAAATAAHEIYGHAKRQMSGQPWLHDNGGPVDTEIKEIEDRTREMHENER